MCIRHSQEAAMPQLIPYIIPTIDPPKAMQRIDNIVAIPGVTTAVIRFTTPFATVPVVELSRADRIAEQVPNPTFVRFPIFDGLQQVHKVEFDGLEPLTHYDFVIRAAGAPDDTLAKVTGDLYAATRSAHVLFDKLVILNRADEDMYFNIELYDGGNDYGILSRFLTDHRFLDGGTYDQPFPNIDLDFAPDSLRFSITGYDEDTPSFPGGFDGFAHGPGPVSYTHLRAHETRHDIVCRLLLEKKKKKNNVTFYQINIDKHNKKLTINH